MPRFTIRGSGDWDGAGATVECATCGKTIVEGDALDLVDAIGETTKHECRLERTCMHGEHVPHKYFNVGEYIDGVRTPTHDCNGPFRTREEWASFSGNQGA